MPVRRKRLFGLNFALSTAKSIIIENMVYSIISFDFTDHRAVESFTELLRDCGALHEKNQHTYALHDPNLFEHMVKTIGEWKERNEFDYTDYVRIYSPSPDRPGMIAVEDMV
jgi:hypothetical protein